MSCIFFYNIASIWPNTGNASLLHYSHRNKHFSLSVMIQLPKVCGGQQSVGIRDDIPTCSGGSKLTELHKLFVESVPPKSDKCQKNRRQSIC